MKAKYILIASLLFLGCLSQAQGVFPRQEVNLDQVEAQYGLTGEDVLVVMIDRGIDYRHPDFIDENGNTRLLYIYDMIDQSGAADNEFGIGTIFTEGQINTSLENGGNPLSVDRGGHGTATTGIICGNGSGTSSGEFKGVAPNAKIISIKLVHDFFPPFADQPGQDSFYNPAYIPIALEFAAQKIEEIGLPSVTLMNIGSVGGPTDGTSSLSQAIEDFIAQGHPFVNGTGDDGGNDNHAFNTINQGETLEVEIQKGEAGNLRFDLWYDEADRFTVSIERPNGTIEGPFAAPAGPNAVADQNLGDIFIGHRGANVEFFGASSSRRELLIDFSGVTGTYNVILEGTTIASTGEFHATLNPSLFGNTNRFLNQIVPGFNINDLATGENVITPTDYVVNNSWTDINGVFRDITGQGEDGELWIGSSEGPTHDNRLGVDFAAPGEVCFGAYMPNTFYGNFEFNIVENSNGFYGIQNAVSAANPLSTGIIALMLEVNPNLSPQEIKSILQNSCREDAQTGVVPNPTWGYGKLDALAVIENTQATLGIQEISEMSVLKFHPNPSSGKITIDVSAVSEYITVIQRSLLGQEIKRNQVSNASSIQMDIVGVSGIYFIEVQLPNQHTEILKIIKK